MSDRPKQEKLFEDIDEDKSQDPVECLGITFENDKKRREYYLEKLREKLKDPEFRKIEGFPIGEDEDILALSDPPYYTACPNPFIQDFINCYGKPYDPNKPYRREPFATDVSEGKNDPIYNAHSYHTKVPHKAIMRYILHYTEPGDIVFDGFCGTGMSGVAAHLCGDRNTIESLGYSVKKDGTICQKEVNESDNSTWKPFSRLGFRRIILNDISPIATFIASNYNTPIDIEQLEQEANEALQEAENECGWMFDTSHLYGTLKGRINYTIWSDVFKCSECGGDVVFWDSAIDKNAGKVREEFSCPHCNAILTKRRMERAIITTFDPLINQTIQQTKQVLVHVNYKVSGKGYKKDPDEFDFELLKKIEDVSMKYYFSTDEIPKGDKTKEATRIGITHVHHFYTKRNLYTLSSILDKCKSSLSKWLVTGVMQRASKQHQIAISRIGGPKAGKGGSTAGHRRGTLYIPSNQVEFNPFLLIKERLKMSLKALQRTNPIVSNQLIETSSTTGNRISDNSIDYIFTDPPFGGNIMYSELNFLWESVLKVKTNSDSEAISNKTQNKSLIDYHNIMYKCFLEYYRTLKPGRWMTVEFHNSQNAVWSSIQEALQKAGFVIADVRVLDKKIKTHTQRTAGGSVNKDLAITAYKPNGGLEDRFKLTAGSVDGVWEFVRTHLRQLPVFVSNSSKAEIITERQNYLLFDRMVAFHVQRSVTVPISASEFYAGLEQRFPQRDEMYYLSNQVAEYDKKRMTVKEVLQLKLFISDESSAIQWLKQQLYKKPQSFQDIHPQFLKEIGGWQKHEKHLELSELLEQNFIRYDGKGDVPSQIHSYLSSNYKDLRNLEKKDLPLKAKAKDRWYVPDPNKAGDLEKLRERSLLKEFEEYRTSKQKRLKVFRFEAVRAGFKKAWQERDYSTIISVAQKIPEKSLQEDPKLLMWYDQALTRSGEDQ
jgi:DNA modification methylase